MNRRGFTLVEIVMVIILLGVLGIIGTIGLNSAVSSDRGMYERQLQSAIRYAQNYAMSHFVYTAVVFSPSSSSPSCASLTNSGTAYSGYAVCAFNRDSTTSSLQPLVNPLAQTADDFYVTMNYGISYSVLGQGFTANYIAFNSQGEPGTFKNNGNSCPSSGVAVFQPYGNSNNTNTPISLSFGVSPSQLTFYIYPVTGLVSYNGSL